MGWGGVWGGGGGIGGGGGGDGGGLEWDAKVVGWGGVVSQDHVYAAVVPPTESPLVDET